MLLSQLYSLAIRGLEVTGQSDALRGCSVQISLTQLTGAERPWQLLFVWSQPAQRDGEGETVNDLLTTKLQFNNSTF